MLNIVLAAISALSCLSCDNYDNVTFRYCPIFESYSLILPSVASYCQVQTDIVQYHPIMFIIVPVDITSWTLNDTNEYYRKSSNLVQYWVILLKIVNSIVQYCSILFKVLFQLSFTRVAIFKGTLIYCLIHLIVSIEWFLSVTHYLSLAFCYSLSVTYYILLAFWFFLSETCNNLQKLVSFRSLLYVS